MIRRLVGWTMRNWLWVLFLFALLVRLAGVAFWDITTDVVADGFGQKGVDSPSGEFSSLARNLLAGRGFSLFFIEGQLLPSAYMPPVYAYFLAGIFALFGDGATGFFVVQLLNVLLGAMLCVVVGRMGEVLFGRVVGLLAGVLVALFPTLVFMATQAHSVNVYVLLNCVMLLLLLAARPENRLSTGLLVGILGGVLALFRPETILYMPLVVIWLVATAPDKRAAIKSAIVLTACFVLVVTPWTVRNYREFGRLLPITALGGFNLWRGQNELTTGSGRGPGSDWSTPEIRAAIGELPLTHDWEIHRDAIYRQAALQFMREHPDRSLELVPRKLFYYWILNTGDQRTRQVIYWLPWFLLIPFFLIGLVLSGRYGSGVWLLWGFLILATIMAAIFVVLSRYRLFTDPIVLIFCALGLYTVFQRLAAWVKPGLALDMTA